MPGNRVPDRDVLRQPVEPPPSVPAIKEARVSDTDTHRILLAIVLTCLTWSIKLRAKSGMLSSIVTIERECRHEEGEIKRVRTSSSGRGPDWYSSPTNQNDQVMVPKSSHRKRRGKEISFDPEARRQYLRGFSDRKRQRRAFGLAMQKVKDRKAKLEDRRETKQAEMERIEQAERQKRKLLEETMGRQMEGTHDDGEDDDDDVKKLKKRADAITTTTYQDTATKMQWGGQVIVTTAAAPLSDSEDDDDDAVSQKDTKQSVDMAQSYAGHIGKFLQELKGNMPGKKNKSQKPSKGKHGAENMKGMGGASSLKMAQKVLSKAQAKQEKGKKRKGKRKR